MTLIRKIRGVQKIGFTRGVPHKIFDTVRQNCSSPHSFSDTVKQNCNSPLKIFGTVRQNCYSPLKIFGTVIQNCNSHHKFGCQNFRYSGKL